MNYYKPPLRRAILTSGAVIATAGPAVLFAAPANAAPTITFTAGVLTINGDAGNNGLAVGQTPAHIVTLNGSPVLGGTVPVADVQVVRINGGAGDDTLKFDETSGPMPRGELDGGPGHDTLIFNGSDRHASDPFETEEVNFDSNGSQTTIHRFVTRQLPVPSEQDVVNISGIELVKSAMAGGPNSVAFGQGMSRSDVGVVRVDLGQPIDPSQNRGADNRAGFLGTAGPDRIRISDQQRGTPASGATVTGLGPTAIVTGAQTFSVTPEAGDDVIDASGLGAGTVGVLEETGSELADDGNDTLIGHPGTDQLFGGVGNDRLEGRGGNDTLDGGTGINIIIP
jgi:Ca2+-binding RTX toxin-like protein